MVTASDERPERQQPEPVHPLRSMWQEYERRKRRLAAFNLSPDEYMRQCRRIADELGI